MTVVLRKALLHASVRTRPWDRMIAPAIKELQLIDIEMHPHFLESAFKLLDQLQRLYFYNCTISMDRLKLSPSNTLQ